MAPLNVDDLTSCFREASVEGPSGIGTTAVIGNPTAVGDRFVNGGSWYIAVDSPERAKIVFRNTCSRSRSQDLGRPPLLRQCIGEAPSQRADRRQPVGRASGRRAGSCTDPRQAPISVVRVDGRYRAAGTELAGGVHVAVVRARDAWSLPVREVSSMQVSYTEE